MNYLNLDQGCVAVFWVLCSLPLPEVGASFTHHCFGKVRPSSSLFQTERDLKFAKSVCPYLEMKMSNVQFETELDVVVKDLKFNRRIFCSAPLVM